MKKKDYLEILTTIKYHIIQDENRLTDFLQNQHNLETRLKAIDTKASAALQGLVSTEDFSTFLATSIALIIN